MSDIRFNNWKHQSGTGGVVQDAAGKVGIGSTQPTSMLDVGGDVKVSGVVTATAFYGDGSNLTGIDASAIKFGGAVKAQANNSGVVITGVATATKFVGDGSDLTSLPAGLGTALSATQSSPLSQLYYVNDTLHVTIETVVQLPDSSSNAYTNYSNIEVGDNINLTIGDDVNLVPDVLELGIH